MDIIQIIISLVAVILGIIGIVGFARAKGESFLGMNKNVVGFIGVFLAAILVVWEVGALTALGINPITLKTGSATQVQSFVYNQPGLSCPTGYSLVNGNCVQTSTSGKCTYAPPAVYTTLDKFSSTVIPGTSWYKPNGLSATTTSITSPAKDVQYTYWVDNSTYYVAPKTLTANCDNNNFQAEAWQNNTPSITSYDNVNHAATTSGASNCSMGANDQCNIDITYQGTAKGSAGPFGGVMVIETNSTLSSVVCTGAILLADNPYHLTYTPTYTTHTSQQWAYAPNLDDGSGTTQTISCQFKNGASAVGTGAPAIVKFYPANWYVSNAKNFVLDTQKYANQDTTKTGLSSNTLNFYWGA